MREASQVLAGDGQGRGCSDSVGVVVQDGRKPTALRGLAPPPPPHNQLGDLCLATPVLGVPEVSFVKCGGCELQ